MLAEAPRAGKRGRELAAVALLSLAVVIVVQILSGAYSAEYSGAADEAAHAVTSLMVRDYLLTFPWQNPVDFAVQYYIHYPKVAIGHWPPGYFLAQALWWLVLPPGRMSAMAFNVVTAVAASLLFYPLARRWATPYWAAGVTVVMLLTREMQDAVSQMMSDLLSLVAALLVMRTLIAAAEKPATRTLAAVVAALALTMAVKPTAVALVPGVLIALLATGAVSEMGRKVLIPAAWAGAGAVPVAVWYISQTDGGFAGLLRWGGWGTRGPWHIGILPQLAGYGVLAAAIGGMGIAVWRRRADAVVLASLLAGMVMTSYLVRAMRESRHWIFAIPLLLLLTLVVRAELVPRTRWAWGIVAVMLFFPYHLYRQQPLGFEALAGQMPLPARMLVSSPSGWSEGCWVATVSFAERRPGSTIVRATKALADTDWNSRDYKLLASTGDAMDRILDESGVDRVILHDGVAEPRLPHHDALAGWLSTTTRWRPCGQAGEVRAYCRVAPPRYARKPIRIDLRRHISRIIEEDTRAGQ